MDHDTFPDVTLADVDKRTANNTALRNDSTNLDTKETCVTMRPRRKRYALTKHQILLSVFIVILCFVVAILISVYATRSNYTDGCSKCTVALSSTGSAIKVSPETSLSLNTKPDEDRFSTGSSNDGESTNPWSGIRLPRALTPLNYEIQLKIDLTKFMFYGSVNMTFRVNTSTDHVVFHRSVIDIDRNSLTMSSRYSPRRNIVKQFGVKDSQFHVLQLDKEMEAGTVYILTIGHYSSRLHTKLRGLYKSSYSTQDGETKFLASSQLQATDARKVFPCFDEPDMKATFDVSIIYQKGFTALANMPPKSTITHSPGWYQRDFMKTPIMSTYLLAFVVAQFKSRNHTFDNGYQLKIWARPEAYSQTEHALQFAIKTYDFFTGYFALADNLPKADHVAVPDFSSGAMENWGLVIYRETALLYDRHVSSSQNKFMVSLIVAHEIAHTWFGNMVTMRWWDDLWLNEGFASLLMYLALDDVYPEWNVFAIQIVVDMFPVMVKDALTTSHPVSSKIDNPEDIAQHFDSISYNKGMAVLRMMMNFAGEENFRDALRLYIQRYRLKNADMSQLWATFSESLNRTFDIALIMDTWARQMGYPMVTIVDTGDGHLSLHQTRFLLDHRLGERKGRDKEEERFSSPFNYKWYIPFTYTTQSAPSTSKLVWLNLGDATIPKPKSGWLLGNYKYVGFFRVMYDKTMWGVLAQQLEDNHTALPEANRAGLIGDAFAFARANLLDYDVALNLTRYLKNEKNYVPWQAFVHSIEFLEGMISNKAAYVHLQHYLRKLVAPVFDAVGITNSPNLPERYLHRIILAMACDVGVENAVGLAKTMFANWMKHDITLSPDLSMIIYSIGIREGGATEWDYVWNKTRISSVAGEREMMMESLAHTQKPWLLWRYINWMFEPDKIRPQDVRVVIHYFSSTPLARMVALEFFMSRWDDLVRTFDYDSFLLREFIQEVTRFVNTEFHLKQLETLFDEKTPRGATKAVDNALALIKANIGWMEDNYAKITDWLDHHRD